MPMDMSSTLFSTPSIAAQRPVPTIFTPPAFCGKFVDVEDWSIRSELTSCVPEIKLDRSRYSASAYYSPAICPAGYTVDCSRYGKDQGPPTLAGETAVICCPQFFTCNLSAGNEGCQSGTRSGAVTAISVQIRWQSSDLSLLQTPPLTNGLPTGNRHLGWLPESSLTFPYAIPADCSSITDARLLFGSSKSCNPLTGRYYSPAICPSDWTVEHIMTAGESVMPPKEGGETVALCCPSGMSRVPGICDSDVCVSATVTSGRSSVRLDFARIGNAVQIRWAPTDLAVLETHPLTSGLILPRQTLTIDSLSSPRGLYKVGVGLALLPLIIALVSFAFGAVLLRNKRHKRPFREGGAQWELRGKEYKSVTFSVSTLVLLIAVALTCIILLEFSCHMVLKDDAPDPYPRSIFVGGSSSFIATSASEVRASMPAQTTTLSMGVSCWTTTYIESTSTTSRSRPITTASIVTTARTTTTMACAISGTPVAVPDCSPPLGAPPGEKWLAFNQHGGGLIKLNTSPDSVYVVANMLPTLLATLFSIPWKVLQVDAARLEPFRKLVLGGPARQNVLGNYQTYRALRAPVPFVTTCLALLSAAITALSTEGWGIRAVGFCDKRISMDGCVPLMEVTPWVVRAIIALLCVLALLAIILAILSNSSRLGIYADPTSILGVAALAQNRSISNIFTMVDATAPLKVWKARIGEIPLQLGTEPISREFGIRRLEQTLLQDNKANEAEISYPDNSAHLGRMPVVKLAVRFICFAVFLAALTTLTVYYLVTTEETAFERFMSGDGFGPRLIFAICGVVVNFGWVHIFQIILCLLPYYAMHKMTPASKSILQSYSLNHFSAFASGIRSRNLSLALLALPVILSEFLPLLLACVPYRETTTWRAHLVSSWMAVAILGMMTVTMIVVTVLLFKRRPKHYLNVDLLIKTPLAATLILVCRSREFLSMWRGFALLDTKERVAKVQDREAMYGLVAACAEDGSTFSMIQVAQESG